MFRLGTTEMLIMLGLLAVVVVIVVGLAVGRSRRK